MKRMLVVLLLSVIAVMAAAAVGQAEHKKDNRPDGGTLSYGEYGRPATLDPITSNEMISLRLTELIFNGLVGINEKQEIVPELAEKWDRSPDGRIYTFYLRKDVTWHPKEGEEPKPFTADDVVFTYKIMMHPKTITPLKVRYEFIDSVEKVDDYTVKFTLKRPILNALAKFSFKIIPKHGPTNPNYLTRDDPFVQNPIGTGPYMLKNVTAEREIVLSANDNYFKGRPHIDTFIAKPFADQNIMTQALMFNAIDMIVLVNPRDIPEIQGDKRFILQPYNALSYSFFGYNVRNPLLADKRVRKAFTYAVNRQEMLDSFFNGQGTIISGPFAPGSWAYNLDVQPLPFDPEKAKALLQEAGFSRGADGIMQKNGKTTGAVAQGADREGERGREARGARVQELSQEHRRGHQRGVQGMAGLEGGRVPGARLRHHVRVLGVRRFGRHLVSFSLRRDRCVEEQLRRLFQPGSGRPDQREQAHAGPRKAQDHQPEAPRDTGR